MASQVPTSPNKCFFSICERGTREMDDQINKKNVINIPDIRPIDFNLQKYVGLLSDFNSFWCE